MQKLKSVVILLAAIPIALLVIYQAQFDRLTISSLIPESEDVLLTQMDNRTFSPLSQSSEQGLFGSKALCEMNLGTLLNGSSTTEYQSLQADHFRHGGAQGYMLSIYDDATRTVDWSLLDERVRNAAAAIPGSLHYHTLVWHKLHLWGALGTAGDGWFDHYEARLTVSERIADLKNYIQSTIAHFTEVDTFTLVNHPYRHPTRYPDPGDFMLVGADRVETIAEIFRWANEVDDEKIYIVNEAFVLSGEPWNVDIGDNYILLINDVQERLSGTNQIDGVGLQGHFGCWDGEIPHPDYVRSQLDKLYSETDNLPIYITEFDLGTTKCWPNAPNVIDDPALPFDDKLDNMGNDGNTWPSWFAYQAWAYQELYEIFISHEGVKEVILWDFYDGTTWRKDAGLFYDTTYGAYDYEPKPAYLAVGDYLQRKGCADNPPDRIMLPGRVEAETYARYNDQDEANQNANTALEALGYTDDVDVARIQNGEKVEMHIINGIARGEWLEYDIHIDAEDNYPIGITLRTLEGLNDAQSNELIELFMDEMETPLATVLVDDGFALNEWVTIQLEPIALSAGDHTLRLVMIGEQFELDSLSFGYPEIETPTSTPTDTPTSTPTDTPTSTPTDTPTSTPTDTPTSTPVPTDTPTPTWTNTPTSRPTDTPTVTVSPTSTPTMHTQTPTVTPLWTLVPTSTPTAIGAPTGTPTQTPTRADEPTGTPSPESTPNTGGTAGELPLLTPTSSPATSKQLYLPIAVY